MRGQAGAYRAWWTTAATADDWESAIIS